MSSLKVFAPVLWNQEYIIEESIWHMPHWSRLSMNKSVCFCFPWWVMKKSVCFQGNDTFHCMVFVFGLSTALFICWLDWVVGCCLFLTHLWPCIFIWSLVIPFLRLGEAISGGPHFPLTSDALKRVLTGQASHEVLLSILHAVRLDGHPTYPR